MPYAYILILQIIFDLHVFVDVDECASDPCTEGGRCVDERNGYYCECKEGYTGKFCQRRECNKYTYCWDVPTLCETKIKQEQKYYFFIQKKEIPDAIIVIGDYRFVITTIRKILSQALQLGTNYHYAR